jgi:hypothetical protein
MTDFAVQPGPGYMGAIMRFLVAWSFCQDRKTFIASFVLIP